MRIPSRKLRTSEKAEIDKLLDTADALQATVETLELKRLFAAILAVPALAVILWVGWSPLNARDLVGVLILVAIAGPVVALVGVLYSQIARQLHRDQRSLDALVDLLWQLDRTADRALERPLARAEFRLRMARFRIGPETSLTLAVRQAAFGKQRSILPPTDETPAPPEVQRPRREATSP